MVSRAAVPTGLSIGEISARTGVSEGTLRIWEVRYRFPNPQRLPGGHRRYTVEDLERVQAVVRAREQGLSLPAAIDRAKAMEQEPRPSLYAALRERFPHLQAHYLPKRALVRLSHAIEDECFARAERPLLFGAFQHERFYRQEEDRWREMAQRSECAVVLADFPEPGRPQEGLLEVPVGEADPMLREWALVCDSVRFSCCLVGWERPGKQLGARRFETVWSVEPEVVREAARICCELAGRSEPQLIESLCERLAAAPAPTAPELRGAMDLLARIVLYVTDGSPED